MDNAEKLAVLSKIGRLLNAENITWAVGASLLLYLHHKTDEFHDIDIMTTDADVFSVKALLLQIGQLVPSSATTQYKTRHFYEFIVDGVDIDVMAGFIITRDGVDYDCSLNPQSITASTEVNGVRIPLQSLAEWRTFYELMGRRKKIEMLDR